MQATAGGEVKPVAEAKPKKAAPKPKKATPKKPKAASAKKPATKKPKAPKTAAAKKTPKKTATKKPAEKKATKKSTPKKPGMSCPHCAYTKSSQQLAHCSTAFFTRRTSSLHQSPEQCRRSYKRPLREELSY